MKIRAKHLQRNILGMGILLFILILIFLFISSIGTASAQNKSIHLHFEKSKMKKKDIKFKMIHNLIIIPVFINGSDTLHFILDTGVSHTMITSLQQAEGISFNFSREIDLFGLGSGRDVKAYHSFGNVVELPGVIGFNHNVIILKDEFDYLSQGLGTRINGLIGYDVFDGFAVEIDYKNQKITLYDPDYFREKRKDKILKKSESVDLEIRRRKPYINVQVIDENNQMIDANLLVDTGASHAASLFQSSDKRIQLPDNALYSYIGVGLSGDIYGHIGRIKRMIIGRYKFKKPIITYPEETSVQISNYENDRNGSLGADILNRFTVVFDYRGGEMLIKPNSNYKNEFKYNLSGIDISTPVPDLPMYQITKIRKGSPAWIAGLEEGDRITTINGVETSEYTLSNIIQLLQSRSGKKLTVGIQREDRLFSAKFTLEDPIK
jgi:predicted aspartyl protease